jgi:HEAT repeat protein
MRQSTVLATRFVIGAICAAAAAFTAGDARSDTPRQVTPSGSGFAGVYGQLPSDQVEFLSTPNAIKNAAVVRSPSLVWEVLEHGEKVECLDCIAGVSDLLYDTSPRNREIAAWWLRRRVFGVFGPNEVYQQTLQTLQSDKSAVRRAYAAYALGEFLATPGIAACASALATDTDAGVRAAAASALGRLNSDGGGALGTALATDADSGVKLAALQSATRVNSFSGLANVAGLTVDPNPAVRRRALEVLDALDAKDTVAAVASVAQNDSDASVRAMAAHALGTFGDSSVLAVLTKLSSSDPNTFVRDQAQIALQRL